MTHLLRWGRVVIVSSVVLYLTVWISATDAEPTKISVPWKGSAVGQGEFFEFILDDDGNVVGRLDIDTVVGQSTHLGRFTVTPELDEDGNPISAHTLSFVDGSIGGRAHWRAANGDELFVTYSGVGFPNEDPDTMDEFPFAATATFIADGGTGRFEDASGEMTIEGFFGPFDTTIDYFFNFEGTLTY